MLYLAAFAQQIAAFFRKAFGLELRLLDAEREQAMAEIIAREKQIELEQQRAAAEIAAEQREQQAAAINRVHE